MSVENKTALYKQAYNVSLAFYSRTAELLSKLYKLIKHFKKLKKLVDICWMV